MSGTVALTSPWTKASLSLEERPALEAEVPDGTWLHVSCGPSGPGKPWIFSLKRGEWPDTETLWGPTKVWNIPLSEAALFALRHHAEKVA